MFIEQQLTTRGIFNGIDSVVIASGNDWRAIEAACQSYAAKMVSIKGYLHGVVMKRLRCL